MDTEDLFNSATGESQEEVRRLSPVKFSELRFGNGIYYFLMPQHWLSLSYSGTGKVK